MRIYIRDHESGTLLGNMGWGFGAPSALAAFLALSLISSSVDATSTIFSNGGEEMKWVYEEWLVLHDKSYSDPRERKHRFDVFRENLRLIDEHNSLKNISYTLGLNQFSDLTLQEFATLYLNSYNTTHDKLASTESDRYLYRDGETLPEFLDWRLFGAVGPIKDQRRCKCCWAFAAIAAIEGANQIISSELVTLSEQQILDCERSDIGCSKSGQASFAYEYVIMNGGIDTDLSYPYHGKKSKCKWRSENVVGITSYESIPRYSERSLQKGVSYQPISVVIGAHCLAFQFYKSGIFSGPCGGNLKHNMVVVGFGYENEDAYWIVRNSWGEKWGENGYIRMKRNIDNREGVCGITTYASYPLLPYGSFRS